MYLAVIGDISVMKREAEKFLKYEDRAVQISVCGM
jgi:hypothetical protein